MDEREFFFFKKEVRPDALTQIEHIPWKNMNHQQLKIFSGHLHLFTCFTALGCCQVQSMAFTLDVILILFHFYKVSQTS